MGAQEIFGLILLVDVMLGPLCTLAVYNPRKSSLRFDMAVIVALQLCALCYGLLTLWQARPVYMVFNMDEITVVTAVELNGVEQHKNEAAQPWYPLPQLGPKLIGVSVPKDTLRLGNFVRDTVIAGQGLSQLPQYYVPFAEVSHQATDKSRDLSELGPLRDKMVESLRTLAEAQPDLTALGYLPVEASRGDFVAIVDRQKGQILGYLDAKPRG